MVCCNNSRVLYSKELTPRQKLLVAVISNMANDKGYCFATNQHFAEMMDCSVSSIKRDIASLEDSGLIGRVMKLKPNGEVDYRALTPVSGMTLPQSISEPTPPSTSDPYNNKDINNKENIDYSALLSWFNDVTGRQFQRVSDKTKRQLRSIVKDYGKRWKTLLHRAVQNVMQDEFHQSQGMKYLTLEYITRPDQFEKWSSFKTKTKPKPPKFDPVQWKKDNFGDAPLMIESKPYKYNSDEQN